MARVRTASAILVAMMLAGCAGEQLSLGGSPPPAAPPSPAVTMPGRWMLSAPNAPPCGMNFGGAPGGKEGSIAPEGGCPGNFFMSRHWTLDQGALTINDHENTPLAQLKLAGTRYEGQSTTGTPVTLAR
jgi:hypothetical protein